MIASLSFEIKLHIMPPYGQTYQNAVSSVCADHALLYLSNTPAPNNLHTVIYLCDTDAAVFQYQALGYPVIAVSHEGNHTQSLMGTPWLILSAEALTIDFLLEVYCRHHKLPLFLFSTARCFVRELTKQDLPSLLVLQAQNQTDPENVFFPAACKDPAAFLAHYILHQYPFFGFGLYAILEKTTEQWIGIAGFSSAEDRQAEVSYALLRQYQKQGYAREVLQTLLDYGKKQNGFEQFVVRIRQDNISSVLLARKCGIPIIYY